MYGQATRTDLTKQPTANYPPVLVLMARFASAQHLDAFINLPPVQALLQADPVVPLSTLASVVVDVAPTQQSTSTAHAGGRLL